MMPLVPKAGSTPSPLSVLVVDDSVLMRRLTALMLTRGGHRVAVAGGGTEALRAVAAERFDVVLMDVHMPGMDGPTVTARLRALGYREPVIALTAGGVDEEWRRCRAAGMHGFLEKPFSFTDLTRVVETWGRRA